jgi:hypothetical protein
MTADELNRRLLAAGRMASLPDPALDIDNDDPDDQPIAIEGEPLWETILRKRRIQGWAQGGWHYSPFHDPPCARRHIACP